MHELSIATNIVEIVEENMRSYPKAQVISVTVQVGTHSGIETEALTFCFPLACEDTPVKGAKLKLEVIPLKVSCSDCPVRDKETQNLSCPVCQSPNVTVTAGKDMIVASIDLDID
ncbi:MAG: hydrogenase maturation nickel metallochaperone HypA [bacterium]|nr:hydrogenase maturation nickel metallochaperone HypA [bacterium]MBU1917471.1 hydrogenase maturation nickel metallochaperone HypA [bacterium]